MSAINISFDQGDPLLDWLGLTAAFEAGHKRPKAEIADTFLYRGKDTLLSRAAWIDGKLTRGGLAFFEVFFISLKLISLRIYQRIHWIDQ